MRAIVLRLARETGGGIGYWMELPIYEVVNYMLELGEQIRVENEEAERAAKRR